MRILLLLLIALFPPAKRAPAPAPAPEHRPLHKGSIDLATGLYVRVNEDLVVQGAPVLTLGRTYLSGYRASRQFGIGTTHPGEDYLIGDGETFQWTSLILAQGSRINFTRVSPGTSLLGATFEHDESSGEWHGAELSWTLLTWTLKKRDGSVLVFRGCGKTSACSIIQSTDPQGNTIHYRRNRAGRLLKMESGDRWIAFEYDAGGRITRAHDSLNRDVRYAYDARGRLETATGGDGAVRRYTYTDLDELATIHEPGTSITNVYEDGRCIRQVNWYPDRDPYIFEFRYNAEGRMVHRTHVTESSGRWREYAWDDRKTSISETLGTLGTEPVFVMYDRDPVSRAITSLTVSCRNRAGRSIRQSQTVRPAEAELLKTALVQKLCS